MPSTYSDLLRFEKQADGENNATWGQKANTVFEMIEDAIAGRAAVSMPADANYTLTTANSATDEARMAILNIASGVSLTASRNVVVPTSAKEYTVKNATTGGQSIVVKTNAGTGVTVPNGKTTPVFCDGTNVVDAIDYLSTLTVGNALTVSAGAVTITGGSLVTGAASSSIFNSVATAITAFGAALTIAIGAAASATTWTGQSFALTGANSTNNTALTVANTSNAAAASHSYIDVQVGGTTSTGDPHIRFTVPGGTSWYLGSDNSDSDNFKIGTGTAVGTNTVLTINSSGINGVIGATTAAAGSFTTISATGTVTLSGTAANIALGSNFISNAGTDAGLSLDGSNNATLSGTLVVSGNSVTTNTILSAATTANVFNSVATTVNAFSAATTMNIGAAASTTTRTGQAWTLTGANSTNNTTLTVTNTSNAAAASHSILDVAVGGTTSTGDPQLRFTIPGGTSWYAGVDNSASDGFYIGTGTAVGSNYVLSAESAGNLYINSAAGTPVLIFQNAGAARASWRATAASSISLYDSGGSSGLRFAVATVDTAAATALLLQTSSATQAAILHLPSAVNYVAMAGGATTSSRVSIAPEGTDASISLRLGAKGTSGAVEFFTGTTFTNGDFSAGARQVAINHTASATRYITLTGSNGGNPSISTSAGFLNIGTDLVVSRSSSGTVVDIQSLNGSNTASSHARAVIGTGGTSAGYAVLIFHNSTEYWTIGRNSAASSPLVFSATSDLSAPTMSITQSGFVKVSPVGGYKNGAYHEFVAATGAQNALFAINDGGASAYPMVIHNATTSGDNLFLAFQTEGTLTTAGTTRGGIDYNRGGGLVRYNTTSDAREKNIFGDSDPTISTDILRAARMRSYAWKSDPDQKPQIGPIAQELFGVFKGAVSVGNDEQPWGVDRTAFVNHLVVGWQDHERRIDDHDEKLLEQAALIAALQTENAQLRSRLN
jgi:hypothetical protein